MATLRMLVEAQPKDSPEILAMRRELKRLLDRTAMQVLQEARNEQDVLLSSGAVAKLFNKDPKTIATWARNNKLRIIGLPGHPRYSEKELTLIVNLHNV